MHAGHDATKCGGSSNTKLELCLQVITSASNGIGLALVSMGHAGQMTLLSGIRPKLTRYLL